MHQSPRLRQLNQKHDYPACPSDHQTDIVIVGWGIAWMMTAYFILRNTSLRVTVIEESRLAHGATGHNAGQVAAYFEQPFDEIVAQYGLEMARAWQQALIQGRELLEEVHAQHFSHVTYHPCTGYAGFSCLQDIIVHLRRKHLREGGNVVFDSILVDEHYRFDERIPHEYLTYCTFLPQSKILDLLQTTDTQYIAAGVSAKWTINSALLVHEIALFLTTQFHDRCSIFEHTKLQEATIFPDSAQLLLHSGHPVSAFLLHAEKIILCTNGYRHISLVDAESKNLTTSFRNHTSSLVAHMIGYSLANEPKPAAISYFPTQQSINTANSTAIYYYMTLRPFSGHFPGLVCIGGPEHEMKEDIYSHNDHATSLAMISTLTSFFHKTRLHGSAYIEPTFVWHGLMGYTHNNLRRIGAIPGYRTLLCNLWCNGVGICSSVYGARKIWKLLAGATFDESIFDPPSLS